VFEAQKQDVSLEPMIGKQNVDPSQLKLREQNVISWELKINESNNLCGLKLTMVTVCNSNDEITPNTNWEFWSRNGGLNCFKIYTHYNKCKKKLYIYF